MTAKVLLKNRRSKPFWFGEPWVYDASVDRIRGRQGLRDGDVVQVCDVEGKLIGSGFYNGQSRILVRLLTRGDDAVGADLIRRRLHEAIRLRQDVLKLPASTNAYRLVHAEADGLPGLIIDRFDDLLVCCFDSLGMRRFQDTVLEVLQSELKPRAIVERFSRVAREEEGVEGEDGVIAGAPDASVAKIDEWGVQHSVNVLKGQKTGYFTDQRDNRKFLSSLAGGRRCLDAFSYTGGFALSLEKNGDASEVVAVDSSQPALDVLAADAKENGLSRQVAIKANVLRYLDHVEKDGEKFSLVNLDPPKIVRRARDLKKGLRLYHEINTKGLRVCEHGGVFATSSCSGAVDWQTFHHMIAQAASMSGVRVQLIGSANASPDHPMLVPHTHSSYLKFSVYRVFHSAEY